jgi:hypothetical protein
MVIKTKLLPLTFIKFALTFDDGSFGHKLIALTAMANLKIAIMSMF